MSLSETWMVEEKSNPIGGVQRIYDMGHGWSLSAIDSKMAHAYSYAWEFAVLGPAGVIEYGTELTCDVVVCSTDEEANEFLAKARRYFEEKGAAHPFTTREQHRAKMDEWRVAADKFVAESKAKRGES